MELQVGVKAIIQNSEGRYLLLSRNFSTYPDIKASDRWDVPGGRISIGTPLRENLAREIKEETGLELAGEPKILLAQDILRGTAKHVVRLTFLVQASGVAVTVDPREHDSYAWMSLDEIRGRDDIDVYLQQVLKQLGL
jgi:ADP-ribose pyrophosphatase YjhB (NUDIX family)